MDLYCNTLKLDKMLTLSSNASVLIIRYYFYSRVCVRVFAGVCVYACVYLCLRACACACVRVCTIAFMCVSVFAALASQTRCTPLLSASVLAVADSSSLEWSP
jgi:hypothetical protein